MTVCIAAVPGADHLANVSLLYLLVIMGGAHWLGRGPAVFASLLALSLFDWLFVAPLHTLAVTDPAEWLALFVFLVTALVISHLSTVIRQRAAVEAQAQALTEADRLKTALLSMVSHDFRSPLASIKAGVTALLQESPAWDTETQRELLSGINQETDRLNMMVGNILALSRLEAGAWRPQLEAVSLAELLGAVQDSFGPGDNGRIAIDLQSGPAEVTLDMVQIVQVLHNLVENALKYSPAGSPVIVCATESRGSLVVEVMDSGAGLAPGEEEMVFQRFYRSPRWLESSMPGTGIGLAVCQGLVEAHGGALSASNHPRGGAVFRMALPLTTGASGKHSAGRAA